VKMEICRENPDVQHVWLVDPLNKTREVFGRGTPEPGSRKLLRRSDRACAEPFRQRSSTFRSCGSSDATSARPLFSSDVVPLGD